MSDIISLRSDSQIDTRIVGGTDDVLSMFERAVRDPKVDVSKMESIMAMHRTLRQEKAAEAFSQALVSIKSEIPRIIKDGSNKETKSTYAKLETISAAVDPIIAQHGIALSFSGADSPLPGHYRIICDLRRGSYKETKWIDLPIDGTGPKGTPNKSATHAAGSTLSYGRRYLKLMIFDIALVNEDDDGNGGVRSDGAKPAGKAEAEHHYPTLSPTLNDQQVARVRKSLEFVEWSESDFLKAISVASISDIWANKFGAVLSMILNRGGADGR